MTTPQSENRREIARRIVDQLAANTELRASLLASSAAMGTSDDHSDIDLITYYDGELPDVATFDRVMRGLGAEPAGLINPPGPDGFGARYQVEGIEVQTGPSAIEGISRMPLKPGRLADRLDLVANAAPSEAAEELRKLVEEAKAIVKAELPDVDVEVSWLPLRDHKA